MQSKALDKSVKTTLRGSFRRATPFVERFMVLYNKIIFNQGAMY